jgi:flagellar biosynthesis regulator FlaF
MGQNWVTIVFRNILNIYILVNLSYNTIKKKKTKNFKVNNWKILLVKEKNKQTIDKSIKLLQCMNA